MTTRLRAALIAVLITTAGCSATDSGSPTPGLAERGTTMTTAKLTRQDLNNKVSLTGKVTLNPIFGLVAPLDGQIRYVEVKEQTGTPTKPTRAGAVWAAGKPTNVDVPAGSVFTGRLVGDKTSVTAGMPIVSAKYGGYGIVADIDGAQAYQLSDTLTSVRAQIKSGPGPFDCAVLGTIAALPAGTIPEPPAPPVAPQPNPADPNAKPAPQPQPEQPKNPRQPSEATGMRLVCTAPADVKLINGAAATIEVVTESAKGALVAPVEAVAGKQGAGKVEVIGADGARQVKDVVLGLTDGRVVQIKSGLTGDETLAVPGPNLPPAPPQQGGPSPAMGG
ncbi:efflux RND transporter periplasmic adaptor subunit [Actinokineospora sp. HUAS TT18]|uniref:efflux RND transporter periplasmic adaptor subunit n=1 Tax=Actinokineospora sp. HUAS TT18 TaxID=3447451 RepID=UPI003F52711E